MLLDSNGIPYSQGVLDWVYGEGVKLFDFTPPRKFETPESIYARLEEGRTGAAFHYGNDLSHHSQQLLALQYLRDNAGFDNLVWCVTHFTRGQLLIVLNVATGLWCERLEEEL
jgi:hypothetical protein